MKESPGRERWVREAASRRGPLRVIALNRTLTCLPFVRIRRSPVADRQRHVKNKGGGQVAGCKGVLDLHVSRDPRVFLIYRRREKERERRNYRNIKDKIQRSGKTFLIFISSLSKTR